MTANGKNAIVTTGLFRSKNHQYWRDGEGPVPGVTTVLRALDRGYGFHEWLKRETARCAVQNYDFLGELVAKGGQEAAIAWLAKIPDYIRDTAGDIGSSIHRLNEEISRQQVIGHVEKLVPFVTAYRNFLQDHQPVFKSLEQMVYSEKGYGGTFDWLARLPAMGGVLVMGDTKSGENVYAEVGLQLAALAYADHIGVTGNPKRWPMPAVTKFAVLHIRPELYARGYRLLEAQVTDQEYDAFLALLTAHRWRKERDRLVIGEPVRPIEVIAAA